MANTDAVPRHLKLGRIRSPLGNDAIVISNTGFVTFPGGINFSSVLALDSSASLTIGNTTTNTQTNSTLVVVQSGSNSSSINSTTISTIGSFIVGNSSVNSTAVNSREFRQTNSMFIANSSGVYVNGAVNAAIFTIGTSTQLSSAGVDTTGYVNTISISIGTNFTANSTKLNHIGTINAGSFSMGSTFVANTSALLHTSNSFTLGTSTVQANNGFTKLPNGLLMQWGRSVANNSSGDITFPVAFTSLYNVQLTPNTNLNVWHAGLSTTAVNIRADSINSPANVDVHWVAYGV